MTSIGHNPKGKWEFDDQVTSCFEDMLRRSIPQYEVMRNLVFSIACHYRREKTSIIDVGASRGDGISDLISKYGAHNRFVLVEVSDPMLEVLNNRFSGYVDCGVVSIRNDDLRYSFPPEKASVILCILTLQFTPIEYRQQIVQRMYDSLLDDGCLILVEKIIGATASIDDLMVKEYLDMKSKNGYSQEEIDRKRMSLEGVLVPLTAKWNEELLERCGFRYIDCFWRWMNFAGWIAVKH